MRILSSILFLSLLAGAQTTINGSRTILGAWDASGASSTRAVKESSADPGTCTKGELYFNTTSAALKLCSATNTWTAAGGASGDKLSTETVRVWDEFMPTLGTSNYVAALGWSLYGAGAVHTQVDGEANHPGIYRHTTAGSANSAATLFLSGNSSARPLPSMDNTTGVELVYLFRTPTDLTEAKIRIGVATSIGNQASPSYGFYAEYGSSTGCTSNLTDSTWMYIKANTSATRSAGPAIATGTWYRLRIRSTAAGTVGLALAANGGDYGTEQTYSTGLPTMAMIPFFEVVTCNATAKRIDVDYWHLRMDGVAR